MRILKTGDLCPFCGQPILTEDPNALRLLAAIADIAALQGDIARQTRREYAAPAGLPEPGNGGRANEREVFSAGGCASE